MFVKRRNLPVEPYDSRPYLTLGAGFSKGTTTNLRDEILDALVDALEQGAAPPQNFTVRIPSEAFLRVAYEGATVIRIGSHVMTLLPDVE